MFLLASCQESVYVDDTQTTIENDVAIDPANKVNHDIVSRLQAFNDSLIANAPATPNVNKGNLQRGLNIALADCWGLLEGASWGLQFGSYLGPNTAVIAASILGPLRGAYLSYGASSYTITPTFPTFDQCVASYIYMTETVTDFQPYLPKKISLNLSEEKQHLMISGAKHNLLLENMRDKHFSSTSIIQALDKGALSENEYSILNHLITKTLFKNSVPYNFAEMRFDFGEKANQIISLYRQAILTSTNSYNDVETISNRYISEISSTEELNMETADNITSSICVLASSSEYWKVFDN